MKLYLPLSIFLALWGRMGAQCSLADFQAISRIDFSDWVSWLASGYADSPNGWSYAYFQNYVTSKWISISRNCFGYTWDEQEYADACSSVCSVGPFSSVCRTCWSSSALGAFSTFSYYPTSTSSCSQSEVETFRSLSVSTLNTCISGQSPDMSACLGQALSMSEGTCTDCLGIAFTALSADCDTLCGSGDSKRCWFCSQYAGMVAVAQCAYPDCSLTNTCSYPTCSPTDLSAIGAIDLLDYSRCLLNTFADSTAVSACVDVLASAPVTPGCVASLLRSIDGTAGGCAGLCDGTFNDARCLACYVSRTGYSLGRGGYEDLPGVCQDSYAYWSVDSNQIPSACATVTSGIAAGYCAVKGLPEANPPCTGCTSGFVARAYDKCKAFCATLAPGQEAYCTACIQQTGVAAFAFCSSTLRGIPPPTNPSCSASELEDLDSTDFASALACIDATSAADPANLAACLSTHMSVSGGSILSSCVDGLILSMAGYAPGFCVKFCSGSLSSSTCLACMVSQTGIAQLQSLAERTFTGATVCTSSEFGNLIEAGLISGLTTDCYSGNSLATCVNSLKGTNSDGCANAVAARLTSAQSAITGSGLANGCTSFGSTDGDAMTECLTLATLVGPVALAATAPTTTTTTALTPTASTTMTTSGESSTTSSSPTASTTTTTTTVEPTPTITTTGESTTTSSSPTTTTTTSTSTTPSSTSTTTTAGTTTASTTRTTTARPTTTTRAGSTSGLTTTAPPVTFANISDSYSEQYSNISLDDILSGGGSSASALGAAQSILASLPDDVASAFAGIANATNASSMSASDQKALKLLVGTIASSGDPFVGQQVAQILSGTSLNAQQSNLRQLIQGAPSVDSSTISVISSLISGNVTGGSPALNSVAGVLAGASSIGAAAAAALIQLATGNFTSENTLLSNLNSVMGISSTNVTAQRAAALVTLAGDTSSNTVLSALSSVMSSVHISSEAVDVVFSVAAGGSAVGTTALAAALATSLPICSAISSEALQSFAAAIAAGFGSEASADGRAKAGTAMAWMFIQD